MTTLDTPDFNNTHVYNYSHLDTPVVESISNYAPSMIPRSRWEAVADFTRSAATDFAPRHGSEARDTLLAIGRIADWTKHIACLPLDRKIVFDARHIDDFIRNGFPVAGKKRQVFVHRLLHRIAEELGHGDETRRRSKRREKHDPFSPYTTRQFAEFTATGKAAATERQRINWLVALALGAGCALTSSEMYEVTANDVSDDERGLVVQVQGRTVVCLPEWTTMLRQLVAARGQKPALLDFDTLPTDRPSHLMKQLTRAAHGHPRFVVERLRATWLVRHLNAGTQPQVIMKALGVEGTRSIERGLKFIEPTSDEDYYRALRAPGSCSCGSVES